MTNQFTPRLAMARAWALARRGQSIYGGSVKAHFRQALKLSWADLQDDPVAQTAQRLCAQGKQMKAEGRLPEGRRRQSAYHAASW